MDATLVASSSLAIGLLAISCSITTTERGLPISPPSSSSSSSSSSTFPTTYTSPDLPITSSGPTALPATPADLSRRPSWTSKYLAIDDKVIKQLVNDNTSTANFSSSPTNNTSSPTATSLPRGISPIDNSLFHLHNGRTATYIPKEKGDGKRKRSTSRDIGDDVEQEASQQQRQLVSIGAPTAPLPVVHPAVYKLRLITGAKKDDKKLAKGISLLSTRTSATKQLDTSFENLYKDSRNTVQAATNMNGDDTDTNGGLLVTLVSGEKASLRFVRGIKTIVVQNRLKLRGEHVTAEAKSNPPKYPTDDEAFQEEEVKKNIRFLLTNPLSEIYGWLKNGNASFYVYCHRDDGTSFCDAINQELASAHLNERGEPRFQLEQLPEKTTDMIWMEMEVQLLQKLGLRIYAWADLTIFIVDHLENRILKGKTSAAGDKRNDWDLPNDIDAPYYTGISKWLIK
jgi:hypothetical protein